MKDLQGRVISIRSHALRLEEELRSLRSGEVSNVQRVQEIQQQLEAARNTASTPCRSLFMCPNDVTAPHWLAAFECATSSPYPQL